jgi:hypothetical protein
MKPWVVVSFYTDDPIYSEHVERLKQSLLEHDIEFEIRKVAPFKSWTEATNYKPELILKYLKHYSKHNIVWLDADAIVQQYPALFDEIDCDMAVHYRDNREILGGTVYVQNNEGGMALTEEWVKVSRETPQLNDQGALQQVLRNTKYNIYKLPAPYTLIFDLMKHQGPPVIEHFQASRKGRTMRRV